MPGRRVSAKERYFGASRAAATALERGSRAFRQSGRHPAGEPAGHYPRNKAEAEQMSHPDWPYTEWGTRFAEAGRAIKRVVHGAARREGRPEKPANSNDSVIALLRQQRATDFNGRFTLKRAEATRKWLERRGVRKSIDAITRMVNRAKRAE